MKVKVVLAFGGNIADVTSRIKLAIEDLKMKGFSDVIVSSFYQNKAVNCKVGAADFINAVAVGYWDSSAKNLLEVIQAIEVSFGRPKEHRRDESRTLDIDIIIFGDLIVRTKKLIIPHPRVRERDFVLFPLCEIASNLVFPDTQKTVKETLSEFYTMHECLKRLHKLDA